MTGITYFALFLAVLALWVGRAVWLVLLAIAAVAGYVSGVLYGPGALWIVILALLCRVYGREQHRRAAAAGILVMAVLLSLHVLPGFRNLRVLDGVVLSPGAEPFTLYLNFDKTAVGLCLLGLCYRQRPGTAAEWIRALRQSAPLAAGTIVTVALLGMAMGYLRWQPRWTPAIWIWGISNLLFTCVSEEALFRGFIQREIARALQAVYWGSVLALVASAILFGAAHFAGGRQYVLLATVAGAGYAAVYRKTQSIEMSILVHFSLNAIHFLFFTYPRAL